MKIINASTIAKLIEAHMDGDDKKFMSYANFIAESYEEAGEEREAKIIRSRIDGSYKKVKAVIDTLSELNKKTSSNTNLDRLMHPYYVAYTGKRHYGDVYIHGDGGTY